MKIYNTYPTKEQALIYKELLTRENIPCKVIVRGQSLDALFTGDDLENKYVLKINEDDFVDVRELIVSSIEIDIDDLETDYYILSFNNEELKDVVLYAHEWGEYDVALSRKLLENKGIYLPNDKMKSHSIQRISETKIEMPKYANLFVVIGYVFAFFGGLIGIAIGYHLWKYKKNLEDGTDRYVYNSNIRGHGGNVFYIGIIISVIGFLLTIWKEITSL